MDEDPLGTKLSLAQEFHAIGDTEGARHAGQGSVIAESSGALRVRAERSPAELNWTGGFVQPTMPRGAFEARRQQAGAPEPRQCST